MSKPLPPLTWFRAFEASARHLSFTLAAEELGFTQSAISQHVRALEDRLGSQLFVRGNRSLVLTDAGRLLLPDVAAAMSTLTAATEKFLPAQNRPTLTIATSASIAHWVIAPHISEFTTQHPDIAINLVTTVWPDDFVATSADIEIRFGAPSVVGADAHRLRPCFLHLVCSPDVYARKGAQEVSEWLATETLIQPVGLSVGWSSIRSARRLRPSLTVDTHGMAVDLAVQHAGVALCHGLITRRPMADGRLVDISYPALDAKEGYFLATRRTALPEQQKQFVSWFRGILER